MTNLSSSADPLALVRAGTISAAKANSYGLGPEAFVLLLALASLSDRLVGTLGTSKAYVQQDVTGAEALESVPANAVRAVIQFAGEGRWRPDAVNPTTTVGMPFVSGDIVELTGATEIANFRVINVGALKLDVVYMIS